MHQFRVVQAHRTSLNLLEPHQCRRCKMYRVLSHEIYCTEPSLTTSIEGSKVLMHQLLVVQAHLTSSNFLEPHHCRENKVCRVHEFGFGSTVPNLLQVQGVQSVFTSVQGGSTVPNLLQVHLYKGSQECMMFMRQLGVVQEHRTFLNHIIAGNSRCVQ